MQQAQLKRAKSAGSQENRPPPQAGGSLLSLALKGGSKNFLGKKKQAGFLCKKSDNTSGGAASKAGRKTLAVSHVTLGVNKNASRLGVDDGNSQSQFSSSWEDHKKREMQNSNCNDSGKYPNKFSTTVTPGSEKPVFPSACLPKPSLGRSASSQSSLWSRISANNFQNQK